MLWALDVDGFRDSMNRFDGYDEVEKAASSVASSTDLIKNIREMARTNPEERASAAQMLVKLMNGNGLSTPRNQVPPILAIPANPDGRDLVATIPERVSPAPVTTTP